MSYISDIQKNTMFLSIDILRYFPTCRVNRDEDGNQKKIVVNGSERARISSQCIKWHSRQNLPCGFATNVKDIKGKVEAYIKANEETKQKLNCSLNLSVTQIKTLLTGKKADKKQVSVSLSLKDLSKLYVEYTNLDDDGKKAFMTDFDKKIGDCQDQTLDIAVNGRMYAADSNFDVRALSQVSHAVAVQLTVWEDENATNNSSLDEKGFITSANYTMAAFMSYTFINLDISGLYERLKNRKISTFALTSNTKDALKEAVLQFLFSYYTVRFEGGANGTSPNCEPAYFHVKLSNMGQPYNHADAFFEPVDSDASVQEIVEILEKAINEDIKRCKSSFVKFKELGWTEHDSWCKTLIFDNTSESYEEAGNLVCECAAQIEASIPADDDKPVEACAQPKVP